ncbi:hypothetical protein J1605_007630 [Eschrichtius robustus]|uniref:Syntabulin n=1 Tax=Eschrichtius robustus TaxID=9764 RepID=A0AB34H302_ESCRO|nr:hypothetical protein J1605_007630 [Eschrichtius robustus]
MGPLRETKKEQRVQHHEKEISRSRIPRLILRPHLPRQQHQVSPASESPFSEEESREFNPSGSGRSARTISSNSFCSVTALNLRCCRAWTVASPALETQSSPSSARAEILPSCSAHCWMVVAPALHSLPGLPCSGSRKPVVLG